MSIFVILALILVIFITVLKIYALLSHRNCKSKVCLVGKTALVTGGNTGIGYQIVLALVQRGCRVIVANRTEDKNLLDNIYNETRSRNVVCKHVELSSFKSVRELANSVIKEEGSLDILIHNAGLAKNESSITEDGLEIVMQVNYFSAFLLTQLLEDLLKKSKGRIIFTGSHSCLFHSFSMDKLTTKGTEPTYFGQYPDSKLCLIMVSDIFAEKLMKYGVTSNVYHPGLVHTKIFQKTINHKGAINSVWFSSKLLDTLAYLVGKTPEEGAQTGIHLACANEVKGVTGKYFSETAPTFKPKLAYDKKMCAAVWEATEEIVKSKPN